MVQTNIISMIVAQCILILTITLSSCTKTEPPFQCDDAIGCVTVAPDEPFKIGVLQALNGKIAPLGLAQLKGLELAMEERNNSILGHPIALQIEDTGCTQEGGAYAALKVLADPQTIAIYGTTCSAAAATASQAMSAAGLTMISGNNSAPFLTSIAGKRAPNWQAGFFRTAANEENAGKAAAGYVFQHLGLQKAATINDNDIYTKGLTESFKKAFTELGGEIVLEASINKGEKEMTPVLTAVIQSEAQLLFFPLFQPEGNHLVRQTRTLSALDDILLITGGALIEQSFLQEMGTLAKGICFIGRPSPKGDGVKRLATIYEEKYNSKPTVNYYLSGYDAAKLLLDTIEKTVVRESDGTLYLGRKALRDALYATRGIMGVSGTLSCNAFGDCAQPSFDVFQLDDPSLGLEGLQSNIVFSYVLEEN